MSSSAQPGSHGTTHITPNLGAQSSSLPPASHTQHSTFSNFLVAVTGETTTQDGQSSGGDPVDFGQDIQGGTIPPTPRLYSRANLIPPSQSLATSDPTAPGPSPTGVERISDGSSGDSMLSSLGIRCILLLFTCSLNTNYYFQNLRSNESALWSHWPKFQ